MPLSLKEVEQIARLARLELTDEQKDALPRTVGSHPWTTLPGCRNWILWMSLQQRVAQWVNAISVLMSRVQAYLKMNCSRMPRNKKTGNSRFHLCLNRKLMHALRQQLNCCLSLIDYIRYHAIIN